MLVNHNINLWRNIPKSSLSLSLSLCSTIVYLILTSLSFCTSVNCEWPNPFWIFFCFYKWFPGHLGIETQYVKISARVRRKFPFMDTASFTLAPNLIISLSIWFWSIAIQAFHWLRQILLCQSSRLGQLKITHSFEVNLDIFIRTSFSIGFFHLLLCFWILGRSGFQKARQPGGTRRAGP